MLLEGLWNWKWVDGGVEGGRKEDVWKIQRFKRKERKEMNGGLGLSGGCW